MRHRLRMASLAVCGLLAACVIVFASTARSQSFAGLGTDATGFAVPERGRVLEFPQDHGAHPDFRIEWWYVTANLADSDGRRYGVQWTLFRSALSPGESDGWSSPQVWMGHAGLTTSETHYSTERLARGGVGQAGVSATPFAARIDDWALSSNPGSDDSSLSSLAMSATGRDFSYDLQLTADQPLIFHGDRGYSVKSSQGQASHYYSQPFFSAEGELVIDGRSIAVTGTAWLDREWSSQPLASDQSGWDWFSLNFDGGEKLMAFRLRDEAAGYVSGTWITAEGEALALAPDELSIIPQASADACGTRLPVEWRLTSERLGLDIATSPLIREACMETSIPYWEGPIEIEGSHAGEGYLEMTGY